MAAIEERWDGAMEEKEIGLIGLGVMGASLCLNLASKGYEILAYNRDQDCL